MLELHVAPDGSPYADGSPPYPLRSLADALRRVRHTRTPGEHAVIWLHPGTYPVHSPIVLGPQDSRTRICALDPAHPPVLDGGYRLTGWQQHDGDGVRLWWAPAPEHITRSLFASGRRRHRPRFPTEGNLMMAGAEGLDLTRGFDGSLFDGGDAFLAGAGDLPELWDPRRVEVVVPHYWVEERLPIHRVDGDRVELQRTSLLALRDDAKRTYARYWLDNVGSALTGQPGTFWVDPTGSRFGIEAGCPVVWYHPSPDDDITATELVMPQTSQLLVVRGEPERPVDDVHLSGLVFRHTDFETLPEFRPPFGVREDWALDPGRSYGSGPQAGAEIPAALELRHVRRSSLLGLRIEGCGGSAIALQGDVHECLVAGVGIRDVGGCGITLGDPTDKTACRDNEIADCVIEDVGRVFAQAVGILATHARGSLIRHNHISGGRYSGISVGWSWDYGEHEATHNLIEGNRIHQLGDGTLSDMGGIYLLGVAPGTVVRRNHISQVKALNYGGWGIYLDAGSSHVVVEDNIVNDISSQCFHLHFGRENIVRGNWFARGGCGIVAIARPEPTTSLLVYNNTFVAAGTPMWCGFPGQGESARRDVRRYWVFSNANTYIETEGESVVLAANGRAPAGGRFQLLEDVGDQWLAAGHDTASTLLIQEEAELPEPLLVVRNEAGPRVSPTEIAAGRGREIYRLLAPESQGGRRLR